MTCAKQRVICRIETESGEVVTGENWCRNPQQTCPRETEGFKSGEGYHLCREICDQVGHAEQVAVMDLRGRVPVHASIEGHSYACSDCEEALRQAGVKEISVAGETYPLNQSPWVSCDCCDDFLCNIHLVHAFECPCPPIDEWVESGFDPYLSEISPELRVWVTENELEDY